MKLAPRLVATLVCLTLLAGACGDDDDSDSAATTTAPASATTAPGGSATTVAPDALPKLEDIKIKLTKIVDLDQPVALAAARNGDFYVAEKAGRIRLLVAGKVRSTVLDIRDEVTSGGEQGLLGLALSPDERFLYVNYTDTDGDTHIVEYTTDGRNERELMRIDQPFPNHNGGGLVFGPDGFLYAALGDGGSGGDPQGNGQKLTTLLGKLLRIDPGGAAGDDAYAIPEGNPFAGQDSARPEIWAFGLRNPWRFSFDRTTGDLWIGDVGQGANEEIDFTAAGSRGGANYGWNIFEGTKRFTPGGGTPDDLVPPVYEYATGDDGNCAVIGGYVYRGTMIPALVGAYLYSDSCGGRIEALRLGGGRQVTDTAKLGDVANPSSFGQDAAGELYVLSLRGGLHRIDPA